MADRQGHVRISEVLKILRHKAVPGDATHDFQHLGIRDVAAAELLFDHPAACLDMAGILGGLTRRRGGGQREGGWASSADGNGAIGNARS